MGYQDEKNFPKDSKEPTYPRETLGLQKDGWTKKERENISCRISG